VSLSEDELEGVTGVAKRIICSNMWEIYLRVCQKMKGVPVWGAVRLKEDMQ
jgi:hypothetical protein